MTEHDWGLSFAGSPHSVPAARFSILLYVALGSLCALGAPVHAAELPRPLSPCSQVPQAERWINAGIPDTGATPPLLSAHRGGMTLAPENTMWAYRHAFAYDVNFVEIDVRETLDGVFIAMHDSTVDRTTNGSGAVAQLTWRYIETLNAADYAPWKGTQYDPARVPRLEEILALARHANQGIEFDIKNVRDAARLFDLVAAHGLLQRSYFAVNGEEAIAAQAHNPEIRVIFNLDGDESPAQLYAQTPRTAVYGSQLVRFSPEKIAAIHAGCSLALPHSYDSGAPAEAEQFKQARQQGADGAQIDAPDLIAEVAERHVAAYLQFRPDTRHVCLRNSANGLGIPRRSLTVLRSPQLPSVSTTDREGCIALPRERGSYTIVHSGTAGVEEASLRLSAPGT